MSEWQEPVQSIADGIRRRVLEHVLANNGGYMSQACSAAEMFAMLYGRVMKLGESIAPLEPRRFQGVPGPGVPVHDRRRLQRSEGPASTTASSSRRRTTRWCSTPLLIEVGRLAESGLDHFNEDGSTVEMIGAEHSPGVRDNHRAR
jgi:transketolase